jgi:hypothetical protein
VCTGAWAAAELRMTTLHPLRVGMSYVVCRIRLLHVVAEGTATLYHIVIGRVGCIQAAHTARHIPHG